MNPDKEKKLAELSRRNPFAVCFIVFLLLAGDYAFRLVSLFNQRDQLNRALIQQAQNAGALAQGRQLEARLEAFSFELLQIAKTNAAAKSIVEEFNIQWNPGPAAPGPAAPGPAALPGAQKK